MTIEEQLAIVEALIEERRRSRRFSLASPERRTYEALKAIATDLRARQFDGVPDTIRELGRRMDAAEKARTPIGYPSPLLISMSLELIRRWPVIRRALEQTEEEKTA